MTAVNVFENLDLGCKIRTMNAPDNGEILFRAKDIADALDYSDAQAMTRRLDDDEKQSHSCTDELSVGTREYIFVTESGLYSAILGSNKPSAKSFKKCLTSSLQESNLRLSVAHYLRT